MYKNLSFFLNENKTTPSQPDYSITASKKVGDKWESVTVGSLWVNNEATGNQPKMKAILGNEYTNREGVAMPGFVIVPEQPQAQTQAPNTPIDVTPPTPAIPPATQPAQPTQTNTESIPF